MTEEQHNCECVCMSKGFRKFLIVTCGSFIGVFFALCLFGSIYKLPMPPMPIYPGYHHECHCMDHHGDFHHKKHFKGHKPSPKFDKD